MWTRIQRPAVVTQKEMSIQQWAPPPLHPSACPLLAPQTATCNIIKRRGGAHATASRSQSTAMIVRGRTKPWREHDVFIVFQMLIHPERIHQSPP